MFTTLPQMLDQVQRTLNLNQRELADVLGCSARTVSRMYGRGGILLPQTYADLAARCHPIDRALAAQVAARGGHTLESLGLERPAAPAAPVPEARPAASAPHLADSIVCAAAEALDVSPRTMRPAVRAAVERMVALGMTCGEALAALSPAPVAAKAPKKAASP